ncbi:uncharacterized protein LOC134697123 [Mytilus trossulus]|uniref:uncharacterized protein LOC134697123 n=1 Tax=Mytilus trossulus TaxID=6551 RepID=UPI003006C892
MAVSDLKKYVLPTWILNWFYLTAIVCTWDASFILCRPHSLPGGAWDALWYLYKYYIVVDRRYMDEEDSFSRGISLLNVVEVVLSVLVILLHYQKSQHTRLMAFTVSVMTFWKTVLYFVMFTEYCGAGPLRVQNTIMQEIFIYLIPNGIWVVVPFLVMIQLWSLLATDNKQSSKFN